MLAYVLGNFFIYVVVNAFTPGPGNILALNTVTNYGWKKRKPLFFGIFTGYYVVQTLCGFFVYGVSTFLPNILGVIKYMGAAYILWLAIHIAVSKPPEESNDKSASYVKGFLLQLVNVKIWMFGITALTGYVTSYYSDIWGLLFFEFIIASFGTIATLTWIGMGAVIQKWYLKYYRPINILLALTLVECIYGMLHG